MNLILSYWSISSQILCEEAKNLWLEVEILCKDKNLFCVSSQEKEVIFKSTEFWENSALWFKLCLDKQLTYIMLDRNGLPTAQSYYLKKQAFERFSEKDIKDISYPLIIKPLDEWHGNWVNMNIQSFDELRQKLKASFNTYDDMIIQEQIEWDEIRVIVVKWEIIIAINRVPAQVIGDWIHSISELIEIENKNPLRWEWYEQPLSFIPIDQECIDYLEKNNLTLNTIPNKAKVIRLRGNSNLWTWGTIVDVSNKLTQKTKDACIKCSNVLWLTMSWVDIILKDIEKDIQWGNGIILEVWATSWIWWHRELTSINSGREILKRVFSL